MMSVIAIFCFLHHVHILLYCIVPPFFVCHVHITLLYAICCDIAFFIVVAHDKYAHYKDDHDANATKMTKAISHHEAQNKESETTMANKQGWRNAI